MREWMAQCRFVFNTGGRRVTRWLDCPQVALIGQDRLWQEIRSELRALDTLSTDLRRDNDWLRDGPSVIQQDVIRWQLRPAFDKWLDPTLPARRPRTKRAKGGGSFHLRRPTLGRCRQLNARWHAIAVPKVDGLVKFRRHRPLPDDLSSATVSVTPDGRWWVSFTSTPDPTPRSSTGRVVGIDRGVRHTITVHDGTHGWHQSITDSTDRARCKREQQRMGRLQRQAARRRSPTCNQPPSRGWRDTQVRIARLRSAQARRRRDWVEQTTAQLVRHADVIVLEDLRTANMTRSARGTPDRPGRNVKVKQSLNRAIQTSVWALFARRLADKADAAGVTVIRIDPRNTSRTCAACDHTDPHSRQQHRFSCTQCGHHDDADINAAINIRRQGMSSLPNGTPNRVQKPDTEPAPTRLRTTGATRSENPTRESEGQSGPAASRQTSRQAA